MKTIKAIILLVAITFSFAGFAQKSKANSEENKASTALTTGYTCAMHPDEKSDKPGKCTKCGMDLQASKKEQMKKDAVKLYCCPMHPEVTSAKAGKCTKCKMDMKKTVQTSKGYSCSMHPEITSAKAGKCSKCGMDLTKTKKEQMKTEVMNSYSCPMHPDVKSNKAGKCSKCGMDMKKTN